MNVESGQNGGWSMGEWQVKVVGVAGAGRHAAG